MIPLVGAPPTIAAGMKKYREVFCRDEGFDHVSRYMSGLVLSENKTLQGIYALQVWPEGEEVSRRAMHAAVFEAGWSSAELMKAHRREVAVTHRGRGREVISLGLHLPFRAGWDLSCALADQFVASSDQFAILFAKRDQSLRAAQSRINPSGERLLNLGSDRRNGQIVITLRGDLSADGKRGHLRVADIEHARPPQHFPRPRNQRQIETFI